jgi:tetrahydrodipicolinate N-succinyltransferase
MKYLKTYEKYSLLNIKSYAVYEYNNISENDLEYFIDHIIEIKDNDIISYEMIYKTLNNKVEKMIDTQITNKQGIDKYLENIIFTSDDLNESISFLTHYLNAKKYNL